MSASTPLLETIEPDEPVEQEPAGRISATPAPKTPVVLTPGARVTGASASTPGDAESGIAGILRQSAHPVALFFLYFFRVAAIAVYILCGFMTSNFVLSAVIVVVLLAMDFWNCRNVAGRILVGLRFWNQVDDDGESYWVFESRDPSRPPNPVDSKMFWVGPGLAHPGSESGLIFSSQIALYTFPLLWLVLFIVSILKFNVSFTPIVIIGLLFNFTNAIGFTYADRDAKQKWATDFASSGWTMGMGALGSPFLTVVKNSVGRVFK
ncbi:Golgi apparatus membrane protein tvp23, variant 4 [Taiwanofungus camphoratus]|nr:Golgi apparatus membrane protein tvp23, variant 2 [Antrodia cinnamomea]KAI0963486.1 Golgi apparatus membrane protein tvp23, variant 4 [Antrodia cinnamomea]